MTVSKWLLFENVLIFIHLIQYVTCEMSSRNVIMSSHTYSQIHRFLHPIKLVIIRESILFTFGLPMLVAGVLAWRFQFELHFRSKILANLTAYRKTRGPTKLDINIIYSINPHGNYVILGAKIDNVKKNIYVKKITVNLSNCSSVL